MPEFFEFLHRQRRGFEMAEERSDIRFDHQLPNVPWMR